MGGNKGELEEDGEGRERERESKRSRSQWSNNYLLTFHSRLIEEEGGVIAPQLEGRIKLANSS